MYIYIYNIIYLIYILVSSYTDRNPIHFDYLLAQIRYKVHRYGPGYACIQYIKNQHL